MESLLVVDDEPGTRSLMTRWIRAIGYEARTAPDAEQALDAMGAEAASVAVCDVCLPGHDGLWLADQLRRRYPETAIIMATAQPGLDPALQGTHAHSVDYLLKPFSRDRFRQAVELAVEWRRALIGTRAWRQRLQDELQGRRAHLADVLAASPMKSLSAMECLMSMLSARDTSAVEHAHRVAGLSVLLARALGLHEPDVSNIERAATLHDVGKIAMPEAVLTKPAELTVEERDVLHECPRIAFDLLQPVSVLQYAADLVLSVREWYNGYGYPFGLAGSAIPLGSRIISVADVFDVMTHQQVYRDAMPADEALMELRRSAGTQFDFKVVETLAGIVGAPSASESVH